ncbi:DNA/RNA non-specific endonuclease [Clavibacter michiganensis]|uniref:DNA/RNA non-specific endonuclease n=1 Tax=Clavibacter michiganensis TaxID=28447 RepID=UPI000A3BE4E2
MHVGRLRFVRRTLGKLFGDHAGHLIADWFGGSAKLDNLVSPFKHVNIREYGALDRQWAAALRADPPGHVAIDMRVDTDVSTGRPEGFKITIVVNGVRETKSFSQQKGPHEES